MDTEKEKMTGDKRSNDFIVRSEYKDDLNEIHKRIDDIFNILRNSKPHDYRTVVTLACSLFITVIFSLGSIMQIQIGAKNAYDDKIHQYLQEANDNAHDYLLDSIKDESEEILRIRAWKDRMEQTIPVLQTDVTWLEKYINNKAADRFTGAQGECMGKRIEKLESKP